jgi:Fe-S-cluster containining protein
MSEREAAPVTETYGTTAADAAVTRRELEQGLRFVNLSIANLRDDLLRLAGQVVALTEAVAAKTGAAALRDEVEDATPPLVQQILAADEQTLDRVLLGAVDDKYALTPTDVPCAELIPICQARCCRLTFALTSQDLDEGVIRWEYGKPYLIRHRASDGYCVHHDPASHFCTVHAHRPGICRTYSCANDKRIWADFERRILAAPVDELPLEGHPPDESFDLAGRARRRQLALMMEASQIREAIGDEAPTRGPRPPAR